MHCATTPAAPRHSWPSFCTRTRPPLRAAQKIWKERATSPGRTPPTHRRSQLLFPTEKAENLKSSKAEVEAAFYEYLTGVLTQEEAAAFAAALNKLYTASKTESRAGFPHFRNTAGGETARGTTD